MRKINKKILEIVSNEEYENKILKEILKKKFDFSNRIIRNIKNSNGSIVNGEIVNINYLLKLNDKIEIFIDEVISENIVPIKMPLKIIYEDEFFIAIDKTANLVVHPTSYHFDDTLANGIMYYYQETGLNTKFRAVNRIDRDTSGIVLIAKSQLAHSLTSKQIINNELKKEYFVVVHGKFEDKKGMINEPIARKPGSIMERIVDESGQNAITQYEVISQNETASLLKINLITGRTHQIRVHFSYINHSLYGDDLYGANDDFSRQALHCSKLEFLHPFLNEKIIIESPLPEDIISLIYDLKLEKFT